MHARLQLWTYFDSWMWSIDVTPDQNTSGADRVGGGGTFPQAAAPTNGEELLYAMDTIAHELASDYARYKEAL